VHEVRRVSNGNIMYKAWPGARGMIQIDMLGNIVQRWHFTGTAKSPAEDSTPVDTDSIHHDYAELPDGNLLIMSSELRVLEEYPTSETDPNAPTAAANVIGDVIVEMTWDGIVLREWRILDLLDPYRIGYTCRFSPTGTCQIATSSPSWPICGPWSP